MVFLKLYFITLVHASFPNLSFNTILQILVLLSVLMSLTEHVHIAVTVHLPIKALLCFMMFGQNSAVHYNYGMKNADYFKLKLVSST